MPKTLRNFILLINIVLISTLFFIMLFFTTFVHSSLAKKEAINHSQAVSNQVFSSMYQVMKRGWSREDLNDFMKSLKDNFNNSNYYISIYRGDDVKELFGEIKESPQDNSVKSVF